MDLNKVLEFKKKINVLNIKSELKEEYIKLVEKDYFLTKINHGIIDGYQWEINWYEEGYWVGSLTIPGNHPCEYMDYDDINDLFLKNNLDPIHGEFGYGKYRTYGFDFGHFYDKSLLNIESSYKNSFYVRTQIDNLICNFKKLNKLLKQKQMSNNLPNTKLIHNPKSIRKFWDLFYNNNFDDDIVYMLMLFQRDKYCDVRQPNLMKSRDIINKNEYNQFLNKIKEYENLNGNVIYSSLNPLSSYKGYILFRQKIDNIINERINSNKTDWNGSNITNLNSNLDSCIQKSVYDKKWTILDLDDKLQYFVLKNYLLQFDIKPFCIIETKNGYHFILDNKNLNPTQKKEIFTGNLKNWSFECQDKNGKNIKKNFVDILSNDNVFTAVPGTIQGGFNVEFLLDKDLILP